MPGTRECMEMQQIKINLASMQIPLSTGIHIWKESYMDSVIGPFWEVKWELKKWPRQSLD